MSGITALIAIDDSKYSEEAFTWYIEKLHKPDNNILLAHCIEMPSMPSRDTWEQQTKIGKDKALSLQAYYCKKLENVTGAAAKFVYDYEKPGEFVVSTAKKENASIIIMGTRGMSKLRRTILGSVSNYVLNHADCPVLVCRSPKDMKD